MKAPVRLQSSQLPCCLEQFLLIQIQSPEGKDCWSLLLTFIAGILEHLPSLVLQITTTRRITQSGGDARISFKSASLDRHLWHKSPKQASRADGEKTDSLQGRSDDCIQTVWQSTLISPCWAVWCYWAQPCTSVSLQCTQWAKPTELMGNGREIWGNRREGRRVDDVPHSLMHIIPSHEHWDFLK